MSFDISYCWNHSCNSLDAIHRLDSASCKQRTIGGCQATPNRTPPPANIRGSFHKSAPFHQYHSSLVMSGMSKLRSNPSPESKQSAASSRSGSPLRTQKRKYSDSEDLEANKVVIVNSEKRKRTKKSKPSQSIDDKDLDLDQGINHTIAKLDNRLLADYIARRVKHFSPDLSLVEVEDRRIPGIS